MQQYGRAAVEAIIGQHCADWLVVDDTGVWLSKEAIKYDLDQTVLWKYACDLDGPDAPDPLEAPCLPIPCTASELAAFMLAGAGAMLPTIYGSFETGPDQSMLDRMDILASKSREALQVAYQAHRDATAIVGPMDENLERLNSQLAGQLDQENGYANAREGVFAAGITPEEQRARRERARASIQDLSDRCDEAERSYRSTFARWRKAMVNQLMPSEARDTFRRQWRAVRLHEERLNQEVEEIAKINAVSISELETKNRTLCNLRSELEKVHRRLQTLESTMPPQFQRDAERKFTIEKMKRSRAIGDPQASIDDWQKDDADINRANQEIDAPTISGSWGSNKDKSWEWVHPEKPTAERSSPRLQSMSTNDSPAAITAIDQPKSTRVPMSRLALIKTHLFEWPTIKTDIGSAKRNGLSNAAKAGTRGWLEAEAMAWARARGKLEPHSDSGDPVTDAMRNLSTLPARKHVLKG